MQLSDLDLPHEDPTLRDYMYEILGSTISTNVKRQNRWLQKDLKKDTVHSFYSSVNLVPPFKRKIGVLPLGAIITESNQANTKGSKCNG